MTYQDFMELEQGDLITVGRGKYKGCIFVVDWIDEEGETVKATWSDMNDQITPDPIPKIHFGRHTIGVYDDQATGYYGNVQG